VYLIRMIAQKGGPSRPLVNRRTQRGINTITLCTSCWGPRVVLKVHDLANVNVKDGLFKPTCEDISSETDNLLGPDKGMY